ncbi:MAG TPA: hypothetical protein VE732_09300 [Nitrososphaera sp.]|nr:hypothetical protein [Nitrososphaera sp.]
MAFVLIIACLALAMFTFGIVMNSDLYGRLIETQVAQGVGDPAGSREIPTVRLVLHRLPSDENVVEASIIIITEGGNLVTLIREGKSSIKATVRNGTTYQPFGIQNDVTLDDTSAKAEPGVGSIAVQSERFLLPALPSLGGFPFDDLEIRPIVDVMRDGGHTSHFQLEIQKVLPGRLMEVSNDNIPTIRLTRSITEKSIVVGSSLVFLFLSGILVYGLFAAQRGLTTFEELLGVGGYLIAAAGFRELLGVSRATGTSALEIAVIGIPLMLLAIGVGVSFVRGRLHIHREEHDRHGNGSG